MFESNDQLRLILTPPRHQPVIPGYNQSPHRWELGREEDGTRAPEEEYPDVSPSL